MSASNEVRKGPLLTGSTAALVVSLTPSAKLTSFSSVSSGYFDVRIPGGDSVQWTATLQSQTATTLDLVYLYGTNDIDVVGQYVVTPILYVGATPYRCDPETLRVIT